MEPFTKCQCQTLNKLVVTDVDRSTSDSTCRLLLAQLHVSGFENLVHHWMVAHLNVAEGLVIMVCDGKTALAIRSVISTIKKRRLKRKQYPLR